MRAKTLWISSRLLAASLLALSLAGCQKSSESGGQQAGVDVEHGKLLFTTTCATCHAADGTGVKGLGKAIVGSEYLHKASDDQLLQLLLQGREKDDPLNSTGIAMPPKGGNAALTESDLRDIVAFVRTLDKSG